MTISDADYADLYRDLADEPSPSREEYELETARAERRDAVSVYLARRAVRGLDAADLF